MKRQARAAFERHAATLSGGLWLLRLRQPFPVQQYPSAASVALARAGARVMAAATKVAPHLGQRIGDLLRSKNLAAQL